MTSSLQTICTYVATSTFVQDLKCNNVLEFQMRKPQVAQFPGKFRVFGRGNPLLIESNAETWLIT